MDAGDEVEIYGGAREAFLSANGMAALVLLLAEVRLEVCELLISVQFSNVCKS